jgi:hypothetical protein
LNRDIVRGMGLLASPRREERWTREQHGNREAKKPKKDKPKAAPATSPFAEPDKATNAQKGIGRK